MTYYRDLEPGSVEASRMLMTDALQPGDMFNIKGSTTLWLIVGHWTVTEPGPFDAYTDRYLDEVYTLTLALGARDTLVTFRNLLTRGYSVAA